LAAATASLPVASSDGLVGQLEQHLGVGQRADLLS
jgi:hypothetical protein